MTSLALHVPSDVEAAYDAWGAACGPAAVAALLGMEVNSLRPHLGAKRWANPSDIRRALDALERPHTYRGSVNRGDLDFPERGLAFVQIAGPWLGPGVPVGAAYRHTHWVAVDRCFIFDINEGDAGGWLSIAGWKQWIAPELVAHTKRADGWYVRATIEVR
jgi:hypothetical protein